MERNLFNDDFESVLKENADQFKMYPSKKVWHGIYNDMHPGRRWPSVAMSLFLVFTLVLVGRLNTQKFEKASLAAVHNQEAKGKIGGTKVLKNISHQISKVNKQYNHDEKEGKPIFALPSSDKANTMTVYAKAVKPAAELGIINMGIRNISNQEIPDSRVIDNLQNSEIRRKENIENRNPIPNFKTPGVKNFDEVLAISNSFEILISSGNDQNLKDKEHLTNQHTKTNTVTLNSGNQTNKIFRFFRHRSNKIRWAYYFTPSVSYRIMSKNKYNLNQAYTYYTNINNDVDHSAAPGFEAGTAFKYSINKKFKFTSGLQFNYSAYNIQANNIHPMLATLMVNNSGSAIPSVIGGISFFSNGRGFSPVKLHNYSFQASVPVGLEYIILENRYLQFSTAANFQPSYIISNHSYLLSADKRNYLTHPSLLRDFNMNTSAGFFVSFKSKHLDLQVGPEVRYQLLSTYKKAYPVNEHLVNYGVRFSVSRTIK